MSYKYLVTVLIPDPEGRLQLWQFGDRNNAKQYCSKEAELTDGTSLRDVQAIECNEQTLSAVIEEMTKNYPGFAIQTYELVSVATRQVGPIVTKEVSKDGILPK